MKKIGLIGYGELAQQIKQYIIQQKKGQAEFHYFDDILYKKKIKNSYKFDDHVLDKFKNFEFYICLGYRHLKKKKSIINELINAGRKVPSLIHKSAYISPEAEIQDGVIVYPMCNVDKNTVIGKGALLNNSVVISHDNRIGECSYISPGAVTSGFVNIGDTTFIGTLTAVSNGVNIGSNCVIGIGSVVTGNIPPGKSAIGNPFRILRSKIQII